MGVQVLRAGPRFFIQTFAGLPRYYSPSLTMSTQAEILERIRQYGDQVGRSNASPVEAHNGSSSANQAAHEAHLSETVAYLQRRVQKQQAALQKVVGFSIAFV